MRGIEGTPGRWSVGIIGSIGWAYDGTRILIARVELAESRKRYNERKALSAAVSKTQL